MPSTIHFDLRNNQMTDVTVNLWDDRTGQQAASKRPATHRSMWPRALVSI
ncbi:hypothetical protein OKW49_006842 [Paraburkholderia youngii]